MSHVNIKLFQVLESDLHALNIQIKDLNSKLEDKKTDSLYSPRYSTYIGSPNTNGNNGTQFVNAPIVINKYVNFLLLQILSMTLLQD